MKGAIGFSASNSLISRIIRFFCKSHISHTFVIITDDLPFVLEASRYSVIIGSFVHRYKDNYIELYQPLVDQETIDRAINAMLPYVERRYGYLQLLGLAIVIVLKRLGISIKNPLNMGIICSELVWLYLKELGLLQDKFPNRDVVTPDDLLKAISSSKDFIPIYLK